MTHPDIEFENRRVRTQLTFLGMQAVEKRKLLTGIDFTAYDEAVEMRDRVAAAVEAAEGDASE